MRIIATIILLFIAISIHANNKVVVIPMGDKSLSASDCPPRTNKTVAGPAFLYDYCWYLSGGGISCDTVCTSVGGANLANLAEDAWPDSCSGPTRADVSTYFYRVGPPGGWTGPGGNTTYRTLGHGYANGLYYGKCSTGGDINTTGTYPGEIPEGVNYLDRLLVCPCFGPANP